MPSPTLGRFGVQVADVPAPSRPTSFFRAPASIGVGLPYPTRIPPRPRRPRPHKCPEGHTAPSSSRKSRKPNLSRRWTSPSTCLAVQCAAGVRWDSPSTLARKCRFRVWEIARVLFLQARQELAADGAEPALDPVAPPRMERARVDQRNARSGADQYRLLRTEGGTVVDQQSYRNAAAQHPLPQHQQEGGVRSEKPNAP